MKNNNPIGIFDSGIGGLTIARAIKRKLPNESLIYFGDTQHLPYGDKSSKSIVFFSEQIINFLRTKKCKAIIVACNSASSYLPLSGDCQNIFNVIDPVIKYLKKFKKLKIGIIGTKATISSKVYFNKIKSLNRELSVEQMSTPLLVPMIEEGFVNEIISKTIIKNYLTRKQFEKIDKLILACTHYPLIEKQIAEVCPEIEIINTVDIISEFIKDSLESLDLLSLNSSPKYDFYASNYTNSFEKTASLFFKEEIKLKEIKIWS